MTSRHSSSGARTPSPTSSPAGTTCKKSLSTTSPSLALGGGPIRSYLQRQKARSLSALLLLRSPRPSSRATACRRISSPTSSSRSRCRLSPRWPSLCRSTTTVTPLGLGLGSPASPSTGTMATWSRSCSPTASWKS